jgi:hypothetical protein
MVWERPCHRIANCLSRNVVERHRLRRRYPKLIKPSLIDYLTAHSGRCRLACMPRGGGRWGRLSWRYCRNMRSYSSRDVCAWRPSAREGTIACQMGILQSKGDKVTQCGAISTLATRPAESRLGYRCLACSPSATRDRRPIQGRCYARAGQGCLAPS